MNRNCIVVLFFLSFLSGCSGSSGDGSSGGSNDGDFLISTEVIRYGTGVYEVGGEVSPSSQTADSGESVSFQITPDNQSRIYAIEGCGGELDGNQFTIASVLSDCTVTVEFYRLSEGSNIVDIAAGDTQSLLLTDAGEVLVVGSNPDGQNCQPLDSMFSSSFVELSGVGTVTDIQACYGSTFLLNTEGDALACGTNGNGQLGIGVIGDRQFEPAMVELSGIQNIQCSADHTLFRVAGDNLFSAGRGGLGLGVGSSTRVSTPMQITGIEDIMTFDGNGTYSVASVGASQDIYVWGAKSSGQLGDGYTSVVTTMNPDGSVTSVSNSVPPTPEPLPLMLNNFGPIADIAAGATHVLLLLGDGTLVGWGGNSSGQIGIGSTDLNPILPTPISDLSDIIAVEATGDSSIALDGSGNVYTFGSGILSLGVDPTIPTLVRGLPPIVQIHASSEHLLARASDGSIWGWGNSLFGQINIGVNDDNFLPFLIFDGTYDPPDDSTNPENPTDPDPADPVVANLGSVTITGSGANQFPTTINPSFGPTSYEATDLVTTISHAWTFMDDSVLYTLSLIEGATISLTRSETVNGVTTQQGFAVGGNPGVSINGDGTFEFVNSGPLVGSLDQNPTAPVEIFIDGILNASP